MCYHYTIHRNVQTYAAGFEPASLFYLKKICRKIAVSFPIFRTFYLSPPQVLNLETYLLYGEACHKTFRSPLVVS